MDSEFKKTTNNKNSLLLAGGFVLIIGALISGFYLGKHNPEKQGLSEQTLAEQKLVEQKQHTLAQQVEAERATAIQDVSPANNTDGDNYLVSTGVAGHVAERLEKTKQWLAAAVDNHYSIQLFMARTRNLNKVEAFLQDVPETLDFTKIYIYETVINGRAWYSVLYNDFVTQDNAIDTLAALPSSLKASDPYLRRVSALKKDMTKVVAGK